MFNLKDLLNLLDDKQKLLMYKNGDPKYWGNVKGLRQIQESDKYIKKVWTSMDMPDVLLLEAY